MERVSLAGLWSVTRPLVGMVHLKPLPGSARWGGSMADVLDRALADAAALAENGMDGILIENFGDTPFYRSRVPPETVAAMTTIAAHVRQKTVLPVGVNVLRNDARAALGIAAAVGAAFIRVNVHTGAMLTDQGWIRGRAASTLRERQRLGIRCAILADIAVKHATSPPGFDVAAAARDTWLRGLADGLIVSGPATGRPPDPARIDRIRAVLPDTPLWLGSGLDADNVHELLPRANGAITGSALERDGLAGRAVEAHRVRAFVAAARTLPTRP